MATWDDDPYYVISIGVHKSRRYHSKMAAFFQWLNDVVLGANAILGAGAFIALVGGKDGALAKFLVGTIAVASALDSVIGFSKKSKLHAELCRRFTELAADMALWDATEENYKKAVSERIKIEKDEPPVHRLIDLEARNDELRSRGYSNDSLVPLSEWQRRLGYVFTFGMPRLERWLAGKKTDSAIST
ncbi:MAG: hypothetical protein EKK29_06020 [Hyphomicrobiales bacterium]|nr:MAG: hypothetical protein EKK29_06020 [Hyphomicrobiales bacterium]